MILGTVRKYFADLAAGLKFASHYDGFAIDNIPATKLERTYHVEAFSFVGAAQNQTVLDITAPVVVRLFFKGYKDVNQTILQATLAGEEYLEKVLASENRLTQQHIKNVILDQMVVEPYAASNDNSVVCRIEFSVKLFKGIC